MLRTYFVNRKVGVFTLVFMLFAFTYKAFAFDKQITYKNFEITLSSPKNFVSGKNEFTLAIKNGNSFIKDSNAELIFTMPEMPGMPKMTEMATLTLDGDTYKGVVNFPHGGTWQIKVQFNDGDKKHQAKSSIDF